MFSLIVSFIFQFVDGALILYWLLLAPHESDSSLYITGLATALVCLVLPTLLIAFFLVNTECHDFNININIRPTRSAIRNITKVLTRRSWSSSRPTWSSSPPPPWPARTPCSMGPSCRWWRGRAPPTPSVSSSSHWTSQPVGHGCYSKTRNPYCAAVLKG